MEARLSMNRGINSYRVTLRSDRGDIKGWSLLMGPSLGAKGQPLDHHEVTLAATMAHYSSRLGH